MEVSMNEVLSTLVQQVKALQTTMKNMFEEREKTTEIPDIFACGIISGLLSGDGAWFQRFLHSWSNMKSSGCVPQLLMLGTLLSLQPSFKHIILTSLELQSVFLGSLRKYEPSEDIDEKLWYKSLLYALVKSKSDRPRSVSPQFKSAGFTYSDQLKLEESLKNNPGMASAMGSTLGSDEWTMEEKDADEILKLVMSEDLVRRAVITHATEAICCMSRTAIYRPLIIKKQGVALLLEGVSKATAPELKEQVSVALARLCMTTDPRLWKYPQDVALAKVCLDVISDSSYELYVYEAGVGLINLLSTSSGVLDTVGRNEEAWIKFFDLMTSSSDERILLTAVEIVCNLCMSENVVERIQEGQHFENLKVLSFLLQNSSPNIQLAAGGALAILSANPELGSTLENLFPEGDVLVRVLNDENTSPDLEIRIVSIISCLIDNSSSESTKETLRNSLRMLKKRINQRTGNNERILSIVDVYC
jgi:hypothetical protein